MKRFRYVLVYLLMGFAVLNFSNCEPPGPAETGADKNKKMLTTGGAWNLDVVTVGGVDRTSVYEGLTISFTAAGYTAMNGGSVWPSTGTWQFTNDDGTTIARNDGVDISIAEIAEDRLVLSLLWDKTTYGPGRIKSVEGQHVFNLSR
jgi:hypothetical protein